MKKIIIFLTFLALLCGCSNIDINNSTNTQNTAEEIKINLTDLEENLEGKIIDFIWLNDVELLLKITKDNNEILFYSYNIEEDIFNKKLGLINENTYSLSRVVSYGDIKYISEFGGDRYRYSDNNMELLERNDYFNNPTSTYRDAVNGNIIYFDDKHSKLYFNDEHEFIIDKDCLPRLISISPDNKLMSYSLIKGISNVTSLCMYDMESQEELCFDVNLEMPYFFWKNNEPVYITIQPSENISFWDIVNSKVANIYLSSEYVGAVFQSSKYNLGCSNDYLPVILVKITDDEYIEQIALINTNDYTYEIVYEGMSEHMINVNVSPSNKKIAFITGAIENLDSVLVIKNIL